MNSVEFQLDLATESAYAHKIFALINNCLIVANNYSAARKPTLQLLHCLVLLLKHYIATHSFQQREAINSNCPNFRRRSESIASLLESAEAISSHWAEGGSWRINASAGPLLGGANHFQIFQQAMVQCKKMVTEQIVLDAIKNKPSAGSFEDAENSPIGTTRLTPAKCKRHVDEICTILCTLDISNLTKDTNAVQPELLDCEQQALYDFN